MNQNSHSLKTIFSQSLILCSAIIISLLLIILIANVIISPVVLFAANYPKIFTNIVKVLFNLTLISIIAYVLIYKLVTLRKAGIPLTLSIKNTIIVPARYLMIVFIIILTVLALLFFVYFILKTNYYLIYKLMY